LSNFNDDNSVVYLLLAAMQSFNSIWPVSDTPSDDISIYDGPEVFLADLDKVSHAHQVIFAAYWFQAEVLNGGLQQFFSNSTGVLAPEAALACRTLGLPQLARKCEEAMAWFGHPYPRDRDTRQVVLGAYAVANPETPSPFEKLDDVVSGLIYDESPGLEQAAINFVEAHGS
jgi:hypothetical protein